MSALAFDARADSHVPVTTDVARGTTFPRAARLLQPEDFVRALKTRAHRGRYLWVYRRADIGDGTQTARPRLGLMIGKKNARTSVLRNAVKRRIREQFRLRQSLLPASQYVVRLSLSIATRDVSAVIAEWMAALEHDVAKHAAKRAAAPAPALAPSPANAAQANATV